MEQWRIHVHGIEILIYPYIIFRKCLITCACIVIYSALREADSCGVGSLDLTLDLKCSDLIIEVCLWLVSQETLCRNNRRCRRRGSYAGVRQILLLYSVSIWVRNMRWGACGLKNVCTYLCTQEKWDKCVCFPKSLQHPVCIVRLRRFQQSPGWLTIMIL